MTVKTKNDDDKYTALPSITSNGYWSATEFASDTSSAWSGYFYSGNVYLNSKDSTDRHTICIHD
jgi:hypothetical protein